MKTVDGRRGNGGGGGGGERVMRGREARRRNPDHQHHGRRLPGVGRFSVFLAAAMIVGLVSGAMGALITNPFVPPTATDFTGSTSGGTIALTSMKIGQTYMFEAPNKAWYKTSDEIYIDAHLSGNRSTLFVVEFAATPTNPELVFWNDELGSSKKKLTLNPPSELPQTHGHGDRMARPYSTTAYSVVLDSRYVSQGLTVVVNTASGSSAEMSIPVGPVIAMKTLSVPMYMFGANEDMLDKDGERATKEKRGWMGEEKAQEHWAKYPFSTFKNTIHPIQKIESDYWIIEPRTSKTGRKKTAFRARYLDDFKRPIRSDYTVDPNDDLSDSWKDGFGDEASGLAFLDVLHKLDGETDLSTHYYAAVIFRDPATGLYQSGGAGLGGGHHGAGTSSFEGVFYHEQGHAFGLGHAESDYEKGDYPYVGGSLKGSDWGYDVVRNEFIDVYIHTDADSFDSDSSGDCTTSDHQTERDEGIKKCIKQSVMQSGSGDQEPDMNFGQLADYNVAEILEHVEGIMVSADPVNDPSGPKTVKEGGRVFHDECTCGDGAYYNYRAWNNTAKNFFAVTPTWKYPHYFNVPLVLIWTTIGCAELNCRYSSVPLETSPTQVLTQVYKPTSYVGNTLLVVNPDNFEVLKTIRPEQEGAVNSDFCNRGCDFTAYVKLEDGTVRKALISDSPRRTWLDEDFPSRSRDKYDVQSLLNLGVAVPTGGQNIERVDIMYTPLAWQGYHAKIPQVVASWSRTNGEEKPAHPQTLSSNTMTYDFKFNIGQSISICNIDEKISLRFIVAIERAVMDTLVCDEKLALTPFTRAAVKCVCYGEACESGCEWTRPAPSYSSQGASSVYDASTDSCTGGSVHIEDLTATQSGALTRYLDNDGKQYKLVNPGLSPLSTNGYDGATGDATDACTAIDSSAGLPEHETCYGMIYRSGGYKTFLSTQCMEPCMVQTVPDRYEAFYSIGSSSWPFRASDLSYDTIHFRIELDVTDAQIAAQVFHKLANPLIIGKIGSKIAGESYVQTLFSGIGAENFLTPNGAGAVHSAQSYAVPSAYPSARTMCYGLSAWEEPPSPRDTSQCSCGPTSTFPGAPSPDSTGAPDSSSPQGPTSPSDEDNVVLQVTAYIQGYTVQMFDVTAMTNFRGAMALAINSPEVTADDVYIISIKDISVTSRKLLQVDLTSEKTLEVYFEILLTSRDSAEVFAQALKSSDMLTILRLSGLIDAVGINVQTSIVDGNTYTRRSELDDFKKYGAPVLGVVLGVGSFFGVMAALYGYGLSHPTSAVGSLVKRYIGAIQFEWKVKSRAEKKTGQIQAKIHKLQAKVDNIHLKAFGQKIAGVAAHVLHRNT